MITTKQKSLVTCNLTINPKISINTTIFLISGKIAKETKQQIIGERQNTLELSVPDADCNFLQL